MKLKLLTPLIAGSILLASNSAFAVTADDVVCAGCVNSVDIAAGAISGGKILNGGIAGVKLKDGSIGSAKLFNGAVRNSKIADGAVTGAKIANGTITGANIATGTIGSGKLIDGTIRNAKIADGAVTENKLSAAVQSKLNATGGLPTYDRPTVTSTQRVYNLSGDFTQGGGPSICQSAGSDTEVQDIVRTAASGGTRIVITRTRFNGGTGGTKCHHHVLTFFNDGTKIALYKREKYNVSGTTLQETDEFPEFDAIYCVDCGLVTRRDGMAQGLVEYQPNVLIATQEDPLPPTPIGTSMALHSISIQHVNVTETIYEGAMNEETFTGCNGYVEDRSSEFLGTFKTYRLICPTVGRLFEARLDSNGKSQLWELTSYTAP